MYSKLTQNAVWFCDHFGIMIRIGVWIYLIGTVALAVLGLWLLAFLFVYCTFHPPELGLWQDPVTRGYGLP